MGKYASKTIIIKAQSVIFDTMQQIVEHGNPDTA